MVIITSGRFQRGAETRIARCKSESELLEYLDEFMERWGCVYGARVGTVKWDEERRMYAATTYRWTKC